MADCSRQDIEFYSEGKLIKGHYYLPPNTDGGSPIPGMVLCHGFAGFKELLLPNFANHFAQNGLGVLVFDYRGFGESEGEAGKLSPTLQIQDIKNAITFMEAQKEIDPNNIHLWGTSFGGANAVMVASQDNRVKSLIVQLTFASGRRVITGEMNRDELEKLEATLKKIETKLVLQNKNMLVPIAKVLTDAQSLEFYQEKKDIFPQLNIKIPFLTLKETMGHNPEEQLSKLKQPILICAAEKDSVNPLSESQILFEKSPEPKELFIVPNASHYEVYEGPLFNELFSKQISWLKKYL